MKDTGMNQHPMAASPAEKDLCEQLSALMDGQLQEGERAHAMAYAVQDEGRAQWDLYHLVGDVLRSPDLARPGNPAFLDRLRAELDRERPPQWQVDPAPHVVPASITGGEAANASVFRWKIAAGFASLAAVAAIGWTSLSGVVQQPGGAGGQLAQSMPAPAGESAPVIAVAEADGQHVMIRDPRLDELLAAHKQFGSTSALQMPAGFLRNATFEAPGR